LLSTYVGAEAPSPGAKHIFSKALKALSSRSS
jgi:hypothetical protein